MQTEHPDPTIPTALIAQTRAAYYGQTPPWPVSLIGPSESELARWLQLWSHLQAAVWAETRQEHAVAQLVRIEQRVAQRRQSLRADADIDRLRQELGLTDQGLERVTERRR